MSDILSKEELKEFAEHPFFHDKIELLEKLKTRTKELLAMYVPMHSINIHALRHYISLRPVGRLECPNLVIEVVSDVINNTNCKTMTEKLKDLSENIISFSNRESDEIY